MTIRCDVFQRRAAPPFCRAIAAVALFVFASRATSAAEQPASPVWLGPQSGNTATEPITAESPLVGLDVWMGTRNSEDGRPIVTAIAPLYGGKSPRSTGPYGFAESKPIRIEAEPGYAVAGIEGRAQDRILGFRLVFMRLRDGKFDPADRYESRWVGGHGGGSDFVRIAGQGEPLVALGCRFDNSLFAVTLLTDSKQLSPLPAAVAQKYPIEEIVGEVERRGGTLVRDEAAPGRPIIEIDMSNCQLNDSFLEKLHGLSTLKRLDLSSGYNWFSKDGLAHLSSLSGLESITIRNNFGRAAGLPLAVRDLPHLTELRLAGSNDGNQTWDAPIIGAMTGLEKLSFSGAFNDESMDPLGRLTNLRELYMSDSPISDIGAEQLRNFKKLRSLAAYTGVIGNDGFASLEDLHELDQLTLGGRGLTSAVLKHVKAPNLRALTLSGRQYDDGIVPYLLSFDKLEELHLLQTQLTDPALAQLNKLKRLKMLEIDYSSITGAGLKGLTDLKDLTALKLSQEPIEGTALDALANFPRLEILDLAKTHVTAESLVNLKRVPELQKLSLAGVPVGDAALEHIKPLAKLELLLMADAKIDGSGLAHLKSLKALKHLYLQLNPITDENAKVLGELPGLRTLDLEQTRIGDGALAAIAKLPNLEKLMLPLTQVTDEGVKQLRSATKLQELNVSNARLSGEVVGSLVELRDLRLLALNLAQLKDADCERLAALPELRTLYIGGTRVSNDAVRRMQEKSQKLKIFRDQPGFPQNRP